MQGTMYGSILYATDGSPCAQRARPHAIELAKRFGSMLHVLYIVRTEYSTAVVGEAPVVLDSMQRSLKETGRQVLQSVTKDAQRASVPTVTEIIEDPSIGKAIRSYAEQNGINLLVMATHGRSGIRRFLFGSIAESVLRRSQIPIYLIPCDEID